MLYVGLATGPTIIASNYLTVEIVYNVFVFTLSGFAYLVIGVALFDGGWHFYYFLLNFFLIVLKIGNSFYSLIGDGKFA